MLQGFARRPSKNASLRWVGRAKAPVPTLCPSLHWRELLVVDSAELIPLRSLRG
jgi:hypothetical protein